MRVKIRLRTKTDFFDVSVTSNIKQNQSKNISSNNFMKSLLAFVALAVSLGQLLSYLITKARFTKLPIVDGIITHSELDDYNDVEGKRVYSANLKFKYFKSGKEYVSDTPTLRSFQFFPFHDYEHELINKYPEGTAVSIRHLPESPHKAFLEVAPLSILSTAALILPSLASGGYLIFVSVILSS
jgi:hypothetical protein